MRLKTLGLIVLLVSFGVSSFAALLPQDVVVIYNKNDIWKNAQDVNVSKAVADYYCTARGIPQENEFGIDWQNTSPDIGVDQFLSQIVYDRPGIPGLTSFLASRCHRSRYTAPVRVGWSAPAAVGRSAPPMVARCGPPAVG